MQLSRGAQLSSMQDCAAAVGLADPLVVVDPLAVADPLEYVQELSLTHWFSPSHWSMPWTCRRPTRCRWTTLQEYAAADDEIRSLPRGMAIEAALRVGPHAPQMA